MKYSESVCTLHSFHLLEVYIIYQGEGAPPPEEAHIDDIMKKGVWKVNWAQRGIRETTDLRDHPKLFLLVKSLLEDLMRFAHDNVSGIESYL